MKYPLTIEKYEKGSLLTFSDETVREDREPLCYLNDLCLDHGSSLEGRRASFKKLTGAVQKACILISERTQEIYIPLLSDQNSENVWLLYSAVVAVRKEEGGCLVIFQNGLKRVFSVDARVIRQQMKRCTQFLDKINDPASF